MDIGSSIYEITYLHATLHVAKLTHSITTEHKHAVHFNTGLPIWHTQLIKTNYILKPHALPAPCSTHTLTAQNTAEQTAALGGQNWDPVKMKQSVNRNMIVFSGNQVFVFDKV